MPVILDGAQGSGAVPVDVQALGCAAYAAAGQKWLCGADGTGMLYVQPEFGERVRTIAPTYGSFEDASRGPGVDAAGERAALRRRRFARGARVLVRRAAKCSSRPISTRRGARGRSGGDVRRRAGRGGYTVAPARPLDARLVRVPEPADARQRLADAGIAVRDLPGTPYLRASVGAWNDESDLERLLAAL